MSRRFEGLINRALQSNSGCLQQILKGVGGDELNVTVRLAQGPCILCVCGHMGIVSKLEQWE